MNHEIGDKVRIRRDLIVGSAYGNCEFVKEMSAFLGKRVTIAEILPKEEQYRIDIDNGRYYWHDDMFLHSLFGKIVQFASKKYKTYASVM